MMRKNLKYAWMLAGLMLVIASCSKDDDDDNGGGTIPPPSTDIALAKKEMRAVWMATVWELDWPQSVYSMESQKKKYTDYLDKFVECNVNAIFVQIRPTADAFYNSSYEPWSKSITGVAGKDPGYDVLEFMIKEAHNRHLEFHAWMNPYRIATRASTATAYPALDAKIDPALVKDYDLIRMYNPALPAVHDRITAIVKDVITKYDVDGIHFDDYFYPDPSQYNTLNDAGDYATYGSGYNTVEDFRRGNVDKVIKKVYDVIVQHSPDVVFSVSPTANRDYNYNSLFADVTKWCQEGWMDVVIPQLYMATGTSTNSFNHYLGWWPQYSYKAVPMIGYGLYKFGDTSAGSQFQSTTELVNQFKAAHAQSKIMGSVMYSAKYFNENKLGIIDVLKSNIYARPAVRPFLGRKTVDDPTPVYGASITNNKLRWDRDNSLRTVIYKIENNEAQVVTITTDKEYTLPAKGSYCLTTVNADNAESEVSEALTWN